MIASLAKLDAEQLSFSSEKLGEGAGEGGQIQIVIVEGLEVAVPMAGTPSSCWPRRSPDGWPARSSA